MLASSSAPVGSIVWRCCRLTGWPEAYNSVEVSWDPAGKLTPAADNESESSEPEPDGSARADPTPTPTPARICGPRHRRQPDNGKDRCRDGQSPTRLPK